MREHHVRALLMGGQACVFYGAAEFSRDTDFAVLANPENLGRLQNALQELSAGLIAVPPFNLKFLRKGHAIHFRCLHPEASKIRVDIMSKCAAWILLKNFGSAVPVWNWWTAKNAI